MLPCYPGEGERDRRHRPDQVLARKGAAYKGRSHSAMCVRVRESVSGWPGTHGHHTGLLLRFSVGILAWIPI